MQEYLKNMTVGHWIKLVAGIIVGILCLYQLGMPPVHRLAKIQAASDEAKTSVYGPGVNYIIRMTPGAAYVPGTTPSGFGEPLQGFDIVARKFEELYPDTRIEFINVPIGPEFLVTQLTGGAAPDVITTNVEDIWSDLQKGWYIPLDGFLDEPNQFAEPGEPGSEQWWDSFKYQAITRGKAAPDGKLYCIPLDMVETGIFYNKDLFEKLGIREPETWAEYVEWQRRVKDEGQYAPTLLSSWNFVTWGTDLVFDQLYYDILPGIDLKRIPAQEQYFEGYLDDSELAFLHTKGFFTPEDPRWREMFRLLKEWRQLSTDNISSTDFGRMFLREEGLSLWTACSFSTQLRLNPDVRFDWDVFYPPSMTAETSEFATGAQMCVIGGVAMQYILTNSAVRDVPPDPSLDPQRDLERRMRESQRLRRVIQWMQFVTSPENADLIVNESSLYLPNIAGVDPHPAFQVFEDILAHRYTTTKWTASFDLRFRDFFQRMIDLYLTGAMDEDDLLEALSRNLAFATESGIRRGVFEIDQLEEEWQRLAPVRAKMKGLPPQAYEDTQRALAASAE